MNRETGLRFEIARDPAVRSLYYALRQREYLRIWGVPGFGEQDCFDDQGEIVVAIEGGRVVGGGRLSMSWPRWRHRLPLEGPEFDLLVAMPRLESHVYGEFSRHVVDATADNPRAVSHGLALHLFRAAAVRGVEIGLSISPAVTVRINRMHARRARVEFEELESVGPIEKDGFAMHLCVYTKLGRALRQG